MGGLEAFTRNLFHATFKTNPYMERAVMTGITRVSKESIFFDLNNLEVVTTTSGKYADCFGFTEGEVIADLEEYGLLEQKQKVKDWYDGFTFGGRKDIYNPWSIINFLEERKAGAYWVNTSSNRLVGKLLREGNTDIKKTFEELLGAVCSKWRWTSRSSITSFPRKKCHMESAAGQRIPQGGRHNICGENRPHVL